jgi:hypothetical protein
MKLIKTVRNISLLSLMLSVFVGFNLAQNDDPPPIPLKYRSQPISKGVEILNQANLAHGGKALDNLKTLKITEKLRIEDSFYEEIRLIDFDRKRVRIEQRYSSKAYRGSDKELFVKQLDVNRGWLISFGEMTEMKNYKPDELNRFLSLGVFGFRKNKLKDIVINKVQIDETIQLKTLFVTVNGEKYMWVFDSDNRLISESNNLFFEKNDKKQEFFDDFKAVDGIILPYQSVNASKVEYSKFSISNITMREILKVEVNPKLTEKDWVVPK